MIWTEEVTAELRRLWTEGYTDMQIARLFDTTRNSVIGKRIRIGLTLADTPRAAFAHSVKPKTPRKPRAKRNFGGVWGNYPIREAEPFEARTVPLEPLNISILEIKDNQCKYIAGNDHLCCGHPVRENESWCPAHCEIVYVPPSQRKKNTNVRRPKIAVIADAHEAVSEWESAA